MGYIIQFIKRRIQNESVPEYFYWIFLSCDLKYIGKFYIIFDVFKDYILYIFFNVMMLKKLIYFTTLLYTISRHLSKAT